jgi:hypothetical protein
MTCVTVQTVDPAVIARKLAELHAAYDIKSLGYVEGAFIVLEGQHQGAQIAIGCEIEAAIAGSGNDCPSSSGYAEALLGGDIGRQRRVGRTVVEILEDLLKALDVDAGVEPRRAGDNRDHFVEDAAGLEAVVCR